MAKTRVEVRHLVRGNVVRTYGMFGDKERSVVKEISCWDNTRWPYIYEVTLSNHPTVRLHGNTPVRVLT